MSGNDDVLNVLFDAVRELNSQEREPRIVPARETLLLGKGVGLDSVALVIFASTVEEHVERKLGQTVSVLDIFGSVGTEPLDLGGLAGRIALKLGRAVA